MSDNQNSGFPFAELTQNEGLDIAAIFGGGAGATQTAPPFMAQPQPTPQQPVVQQPAMQQSVAVQQPAMQQPTAPQQMPAQPTTQQPIPAQPVMQQPAPVQMPAAQAPAPIAPQPAAAPPASGDLISAAFAQQETEAAQNAAKSLFEKAPIFSYGSARDDISDASMTFEELRIAKSEDFPELAEGKRVSWSVEYGKVTKQITDPKGATIRSVKEEIERSKAFLDGLKKAKEKNPDCLVKPRVTAQSKGIANYKGVFSTVEEAQASDKSICIIPGSDGKVYELRKTEMGEFIAPKNKIVEFSAVRAGFTPALPLIPLSLLQQIISFFRCYMNEEYEFEALAHILWDRETEEFVVHIPKQEVSKARIDADLQRDTLPEERYLHYCDIHSHNSMAAKFSPTDDRDERATRIYMVLGKLDCFFPEITVRMSCGGAYQLLDPATVIEGLGASFPREWRDNVKPMPHGKRWLKGFMEEVEAAEDLYSEERL